jgi:cytidyltransferase-like protein
VAKIQTLRSLSKICHHLRAQHKTIGLITGCFDVIHYGHINLLNYAKKRVDILIVGLENDQTIRLNKGKGRPIFGQIARARVMAEMVSVDYVFVNPKTLAYRDPQVNHYYERLTQKLGVTALITNGKADPHVKEKQFRAKKLGIRLGSR